MLTIRREDRVARLQVYVAPHCAGSDRACLLAERMRSLFPALAVEVVDLTRETAPPDFLIGTPTFALDGRVLSLGNPLESVLARQIENALSMEGMKQR